MKVIDTHCHVSDVWFEPVETLLFQMDLHGVTQAVLTQLLGQTNNDYLRQCVERHAPRFASVVAVDATTTGATNALRTLAAEGARGVRLRPEVRSPGPDALAIWRTAADCSFTVSCVGAAASFLAPEFAELLRALPTLRVLAEHLCGWGRPDCDATEATLEGICQLARFPNLYVKVPPLGQLVKRDPTLPPSGRTLALGPASVALKVLEVFGADRLCWASDFPVVSSREGYGNALRWSMELFEKAPAAVRAEVFSGTAQRLFGFDA